MRVKDRRLTEPQDALCGIVAGVVSRTLTSPLDVAKIWSQVGMRGAATTYSLCNGGALKLACDICRREGWRSLFKGNLVECTKMLPYTAVQYGTFYILRATMLDPYGQVPMGSSVILASLCGVFATTATYPLDTVKTRLIMQPYPRSHSAYKSIRDAFRTMYKDEGFLSLYRGMSTSLLESVPAMAILFSVYELMAAVWPIKRDTLEASFKHGVVASAASQLAIHPLDTIRRKMQAQSAVLLNRGGVDIDFNGVVSCYRTIVEKQGYMALYRGFLPALLRVAPFSVAMYYSYNSCRAACLHLTGRADMPSNFQHEDALDHALYLTTATAYPPFHPLDQTARSKGIA